MKETLVMLTCCVLSTCAAVAQVNFGLKAGVGLTKVAFVNFPDYLNDEDTDFRFAYLGGITLNNSFTDAFSISTELLYELKGTKFPADEVSEANTLNLHYLSLPILANYEIFPGLRAELGPQISYRLSADFEKQAPDSPVKAEDIYNEKWDLGIIGGLKYYTASNIFINARYTHGLSSVSDLKFTDINGEPSLTIKSRNRAFQLSLGYEFNTGKK